MERRVIVGMPVYCKTDEDFESMVNAITSLVESTQFPFHLLIVESGSNQKTLNYLDGLNSKDIEVINTPKEGPLKAYNKIFQIAKERQCDLYLTQTDVTHFKLFK